MKNLTYPILVQSGQVGVHFNGTGPLIMNILNFLAVGAVGLRY